MSKFTSYIGRVASIAEEIETVQRDLHVDTELQSSAKLTGEVLAHLTRAHNALEEAFDLMVEGDSDSQFTRWATSLADFATPTNFPVEYAASEDPTWLPRPVDYWLTVYREELEILHSVGIGYDVAARVMIAYECNEYRQPTTALRLFAALADVTEVGRVQ